jgi:hypothetical protein
LYSTGGHSPHIPSTQQNGSQSESSPHGGWVVGPFVVDGVVVVVVVGAGVVVVVVVGATVVLVVGPGVVVTHKQVSGSLISPDKQPVLELLHTHEQVSVSKFFNDPHSNTFLQTHLHLNGNVMSYKYSLFSGH